MTLDISKRSMEEYTELLRIDKHNLDDCIERQAGLFNEIAVALANAISVRDHLKKSWEEEQAACAALLRSAASKSGTKMTDKAVTEAVAEDDEVSRIYKDYLSAKRDVDLWGALKESYLQRSYMIKELAQLYISGYFADQTFKSAEAVGEDLKADSARKSAATRRRPLKRREK